MYCPGRTALVSAARPASALRSLATISGSSPRDRLVRSRPPGEGRLVKPTTTPCSLTASQVPPARSSRPPSTLGLESRSTLIECAGRSSRSSRLAATISGCAPPGCQENTRRHIGVRVPVDPCGRSPRPGWSPQAGRRTDLGGFYFEIGQFISYSRYSNDWISPIGHKKRDFQNRMYRPAAPSSSRFGCTRPRCRAPNTE